MSGRRVERGAWDNSYLKGTEIMLREKQLGRAIQRTLTILQLYLKTMEVVSLEESWSLRSRISGSDPQIYPGTFQFLWTFVSCLFENYCGRSIADLEAKDEAKDAT